MSKQNKTVPKDVTREQFLEFLVSYPRPLVKFMATICDPVCIYWEDGEEIVAVNHLNHDRDGSPDSFKVYV